MKENKPHLTPVSEATQIILENSRSWGTETIKFDKILGRVLAEPLIADRDFPPFNRVTMDGIAINWKSYHNGTNKFSIQATQTAGDSQLTLSDPTGCIEVMTGSVLPVNTDTIVKYEDIEVIDKVAIIKTAVKEGQNIHKQGEDCQKGNIIVHSHTVCQATHIAIAASIGAMDVLVKKLPKVCIITSGDELVAVNQIPLPQQIRSSNIYAIAALLAPYHIQCNFVHIPDDPQITEQQIAKALSSYDVLILCGGVSQGKKDYIPATLANLGVEKLFHKVAQQPGKPFWFGKKEGKIVFALPGNPVSAFLCTRRYCIPWLRQSLGLPPLNFIEVLLAKTYIYKNPLTYFLQAKTLQEKSTILAIPQTGNGSGDFVNMVEANGFVELPSERDIFEANEVVKFWEFEYAF